MTTTISTHTVKLSDTYIAEWPKTIAHGFLQTVKNHPNVIASQSVGKTDALTWSQIYTQTTNIAASLKKLGVNYGDTVAIMMKNRPEFLIADIAAMCLGAAPFSLYATLPVSQIIPQLENSDTKILICEQAFLPQIIEARRSYPQLEHIILVEGGGTEDTIDWSSLLVAAPAGFNLEAQVDSVNPDDLGTIIYTSGTTGPAKGVELTHSGLVALVRTNDLFLDLRSEQRFLCWLPLAGMAERITSHYQPLLCGGIITYCDNPADVIAALPQVRPHIFFSPPRLWEKIKDLIEARWVTLPEVEQEAIHHTLAKHLERVKLEQQGAVVPQVLSDECQASDLKLFKPVREAIGFDADNLYITSGGAAASPELLKFFYAIGLPLDECYGQTESCALGTRNPRDAMRLGSVGKAQEGIEFKFAEDNEILIRSPALMRSYRKQPEKTAETKDADGWLYTGDIGAIDAEGYIKIVDRKKDMIINSFGKNMSPVNIEAAITDAGSFIAQAVTIGDARGYNTALVTLNSEYTLLWAKEHKLPNADDFTALINDPRINSEVEAEVIRGNQQLARVEQIKKFEIVGKEWGPGDDEITPTMKLKRKLIAELYAEQIKALYQ